MQADAAKGRAHRRQPKVTQKAKVQKPKPQTVAKSDDLFKRVLAAALRNNNNIKIWQKEVEAKKEEISIAKAGFLPKAELSFGVSRESQRTVNCANANNPANTTNKDAGWNVHPGVAVTYNIYNSGRTVADYNRAVYSVAAKESELAQNIQQILLSVAKLYLDLYKKIQEYKYLHVLLEARKCVLNTAVAMLETGSEKEASVLQAQAAYNETEAQYITCKSEIESMRAAIKEKCSIDLPENITVPENLGKDMPKDIKTLLDKAVKNNPDLIAALDKAKAAEKEFKQKSAGDGVSVDLVVKADYTGYLNNSKRSENSQNRKTQIHSAIGIDVKIPIDFGGANRASTRAAMIMFGAAKEDVVSKQKGVKKEVEENFNNYVAAKRNIVLEEKAIVARRKVCDSTFSEYQNGIKTMNDVLESQTHLFKASLEYASMYCLMAYSLLKLQALIGEFNEKQLQLSNVAL